MFLSDLLLFSIPILSYLRNFISFLPSLMHFFSISLYCDHLLFFKPFPLFVHPTPIFLSSLPLTSPLCYITSPSCALFKSYPPFFLLSLSSLSSCLHSLNPIHSLLSSPLFSLCNSRSGEIYIQHHGQLLKQRKQRVAVPPVGQP